MFTGIVETLGRVLKTEKRRGVLHFTIECPRVASGVKIGGSVAVNGVCLTVVARKGPVLFFDVVRETQKRSGLGELKPLERVNLERPLRAGGRFEGHFVLGHVDARGRVIRALGSRRQRDFLISFPKKLKRYVREKGSIVVDGVSLTVGKVSKGAFWTHCIPHTLKNTNFSVYRSGRRVNLEADILIKAFLRDRRRIRFN